MSPCGDGRCCRRSCGGRIINLSSIVAHRGALYGHCRYAATRGAILSFTAAAYLAGEGGDYLTGVCLDVNGGMYFHWQKQ